MRTIRAVVATLFCALPARAADLPAAPPVIERQLAAYQAKNLDAFVACYAPDVELYEFPDKLLAKGAAALRERYQARFADPILRAEIIGRVTIGDKVIDREQIVRTFPEGPGTWEVVVIYELRGALIAKVWFIFGAKVLDKK